MSKALDTALEAVSRIGKPEVVKHSKALDALIAFVENDLERQQSMLRCAKIMRDKCPHPELQDERIAEKEKEIEATIALLKLARGEG